MQYLVKYTLVLFLATAISSSLQGQKMQLEIEGGLQVGNDNSASPNPGTIRWDGKDFEGWNGKTWVSLTGGKTVGTVTDIHGNTYPTIKVGYREWMAENLAVTIYNDGTHIANITVTSTWLNLSSGARCSYNNDLSFVADYGYLYNHFAVETGKLCPVGWDVPTKEEWHQFFNEFGGQEHTGFYMKDIDSGLWFSSGLAGNNSSGFSAVPGGFRSPVNGGFFKKGQFANFWAKDQPVVYSLFYQTGGANSQIFGQQAGLSVRCIKSNTN